MLYCMAWKEPNKQWREIECRNEIDLESYYNIYIDYDDIEVHFFYCDKEYTPQWME